MFLVCAGLMTILVPLQVETPATLIGGDVTTLRTRSMEIRFTIQTGASPLLQVTLWITTDRGQTWLRHDHSTRRPGVIQFEAPGDGLYGLYLVAANEAGPSAPVPGAGTPPQRWVFVDATPPLLQLQGLETVEGGGMAALVVSWTAYDANLGHRPVSLFYQMADELSWHRIASGVGNIGRFDWLIPQDLRGSIRVKLEVQDRAGNVAAATSSPILLSNSPIDPAALDGAGALLTAPQPGTAPDVLATIDMPKARQLYDLGLWYKQRGNYALAAERLVEALNLDPDSVLPAYELADIYHNQGDFRGALNIYQSILDRDAGDYQARRGSALAMVALSRYPDALHQFERMLREQPDDAEVWLQAGDILLGLGRQDQARQYWQQARRLSPRTSSVLDKAAMRLNRYVTPPS